MIIFKKTLPRRTLLRGIGASLALPLLDSMVPALSSASAKTAQPAKRMGVVYVPNGMAMKSWTPATEGSGFEITRILRPMAAYQDRMLVLTGLNGSSSNAGVHASASTRFLTGTIPARSESDLQAAVSVDQLVARELGKQTQLGSLELALDQSDVFGSCDIGFSCQYTSTIAWRDAHTPLPMETNPRVVFERLFGDTGTTDPAVRLKRIRKDQSLLDSVSDRVSELNRKVDAGDRAKLDQYLDAVRDVERRIQLAEAQSDRELPLLEQPAGVPQTYEEHAKLMFDMQVLAYQTDLTRVITFMMGRELSGRTYAEIGVPDSHHPTSHHRDDPTLYEKVTKINEFHTSLFAYYLDKLDATPDGNGSLLDNLLMLYGAGMSDSNRHDNTGLPLVLLGGGSGSVKGGRHLRYKEGTPISNLHLTMLDKMGLPLENLVNSTGPLNLLGEV
ncbi:DUF1552 domain-containing protein [bacterium]|nr:DUF1552 domain-containing protein [bacterium]MDA9902614.1 DUF1552 domain-containing protein [Gammaproteobacteria bacterium]MDG2119488.1 DUF1552 domain-containing protein [Gammaproteobacteria bacterium]|tara:strand:- start:4157 stop:5491 length:1335 start_codon:yes stop_codon:yes gene_type:complete